MLTFKITNRIKPPPPFVYQGGSYFPPQTPGKTYDEAMRRDRIIKEAYKACPFNRGQVVVPVNEKDHEVYGDCIVYAIASSYAEYGRDSGWPVNDVPLILAVVPDKTSTCLFTTVNYFKAKV